MPRTHGDRPRPSGAAWLPPTLLSLLALSMVALAGCVSAAEPASGEEPGPPLEYHRLGDLAVGDCVDLIVEADDLEVLAVVRRSCRGPHDAEVVGIAAHPTSRLADYPGETKLLAWAEHACLAAIEGYVGLPYKDTDLMAYYYIPTVETWASGDRASQCLVTGLGTGSLDAPIHDRGG